MLFIMLLHILSTHSYDYIYTNRFLFWRQWDIDPKNVVETSWLLNCSSFGNKDWWRASCAFSLEYPSSLWFENHVMASQRFAWNQPNVSSHDLSLLALISIALLLLELLLLELLLLRLELLLLELLLLLEMLLLLELRLLGLELGQLLRVAWLMIVLLLICQESSLSWRSSGNHEGQVVNAASHALIKTG